MEIDVRPQPRAAPRPPPIVQDVEMESNDSSDDGAQLDLQVRSRTEKAANAIPRDDKISMINNTVRMALFAELRGQGLKKDDIRKMICKDGDGNGNYPI